MGREVILDRMSPRVDQLEQIMFPCSGMLCMPVIKSRLDAWITSFLHAWNFFNILRFQV